MSKRDLYKRAFKKAWQGKDFTDELPVALNKNILIRYGWVVLCILIGIASIPFFGYYSIIVFLCIYFGGGVIVWMQTLE